MFLQNWGATILLRLDEDESQAFLDRIAATAIVNQAAIKFMMLGLPANGENVTRLIGDIFDPLDPRHDRLLDKVLFAIHEVAGLSALGQNPKN